MYYAQEKQIEVTYSVEGRHEDGDTWYELRNGLPDADLAVEQRDDLQLVNPAWTFVVIEVETKITRRVV